MSEPPEDPAPGGVGEPPDDADSAGGSEPGDQPPADEPDPRHAERSKPRGHVTVFADWCKGCGICIAFCPQEVFEAGPRGGPTVAHEERCTACGWCVTHCPDMAISVHRLGPDELAELEERQDQAAKGALPAGSDS